jgi:lysophospholipase L1-like esterase
MMAGLGWLRRGALLLGLVAFAASAGAADPKERWVAAWATSQQIPEERNALPPEDLKDATLRQVVRIRLAGDRLRVRFSNAYGTAPLRIGAATIARAPDPASSKLDPASVKPLSFGGKPWAVIPAGADYWSDPVALPVAAGTDLAVSIYLPEAPARQTSHPGSRATSYYVHGDLTAAAELPGAKTVDHWYQLAGIETVSAKATAVLIIGDSITDGSGVKPNTNLRWPDALQLRMRATKGLEHMAVLNGGIGGNRLLLDGLGPNALARFDREVLSPPGITHLILFEGVNDLGTYTRDAPQTAEAHAAHVHEMIGALRQMAERARSRGIKVIGATIMAFGGSGYYHPDAATEADRQAVNAWIRAPGNFDAVIDFDAATRDPVDPSRLRADYDSGDGLHPSIAGYQAMAEAVPLELLGGKPGPKKRAKPEPGPAIALTFDDMPAHSALPPGVTRVEIADRIIAALKEAKAPAFGFVNGAFGEREPASQPVLAAWRKAGQPLGNHGWSHANLANLTDEAFVTEVAKNEPLLESLMGKQDWKWFRYPFLSEASDDPERRAHIRKLLAARGYKVAPVTMGFSDWAYNEPYARCVAKGDQAGIAQLRSAWLAGVEADAMRARAMARTLEGREIPHVLLMHLGAFDAVMMPETLAIYRRLGFRFVGLDEAVRDPYYKTDRDPSLTPDPQSLESRLAAKQLPVPTPVPMPPVDSLCK